MTDLPIHLSIGNRFVKQSKMLRLLDHSLSTAWLILRDFRNGLLGAGLPVSKAYEMIYVEPYRCNEQDDQHGASEGKRRLQS